MNVFIMGPYLVALASLIGAPSPGSSDGAIKFGPVRVEALHFTQPIPPTPVTKLVVHQSAALASYVEFSGHAARTHLALSWLVRTHGATVLKETQLHTVSWSGITFRRFALSFAPCVAGEYVATFRLAGGAFPDKNEVRAFRVLGAAGRVGDTLQSPANGNVTLTHASTSQRLQYAPGMPYTKPKQGDNFLTTSWTIMNMTSLPVNIPTPIVVSGGISYRGFHLGGVPYSSPLAPRMSESLAWAFEVPTRGKNVRIDYTTKQTSCGGKLTWRL
jgi:hypothetical protein